MIRDAPARAALASLVVALAAAGAGGAWLRVTRVASDPPVSEFVLWTLVGGVLTAVLALLMAPTFRRVDSPRAAAGSPRAARGERLAALGLPNALTLARLVLIAPTVVLLAQTRYPEALACYVVLFATDIADGVVARRRGLESEFGVVADPLADVASTFGVFTVFAVQGLCPPWLYALLVTRYATLLLGSLGLFLAVGPFKFKATAPGKIVGVIQAVGASIVIAGAMLGGLDSTTETVLFAFLGIGFASIVVSQALIGWRLARRR